MLKKSIVTLLVGCALVSSSNAMTPVSMNSMEINRRDLFVPARLGNVRVFHDGQNFQINHNSKLMTVENAFVDPIVRNITNEQLGYFLGNIRNVEIDGKMETLYRLSEEEVREMRRHSENFRHLNLNADQYRDIQARLSGHNLIEVSELSDGTLCIHAKMGLNGGGPVLGTIVYWAIKVVGHGTLTLADIITFGGTLPLHTSSIPVIEFISAVTGAVTTAVPTP